MADSDLQGWLDTLAAMPPPAVWATLAGAAAIEYVAPPFPGDTVVVAGAVLVGAFGWPVAPVLGAVTAGALLGSAIDFQAGRWLAASGRLERMSPTRRAAVDHLVEGFRRHGAWYLALNRFVPGVRALFFVAAGLAGLRWPAVMLWSAVSALAWNGLLIAGGVWAGANLDALASWVHRYQVGVGIAVSVVLVLVAVRTWRAVRPQ